MSENYICGNVQQNGKRMGLKAISDDLSCLMDKAKYSCQTMFFHNLFQRSFIISQSFYSIMQKIFSF